MPVLAKKFMGNQTLLCCAQLHGTGQRQTYFDPRHELAPGKDGVVSRGHMDTNWHHSCTPFSFSQSCMWFTLGLLGQQYLIPWDIRTLEPWDGVFSNTVKCICDKYSRDTVMKLKASKTGLPRVGLLVPAWREVHSLVQNIGTATCI